jgi:Cys-tRNA(Pro) deacylase
MGDAVTPVGQELRARGVPFREFQHPAQVHSLEQAAAERNQRPEQVVRSILFRLAQDDFLMVLVAGPQQIDWKRLRRELNQSRMTMASAEEVLSVTGFEIGAVSPFALPRPLPVLIDESVMREAEVSIGSGIRGAAIIMSSVDLLRALGEVQRVDVSQSG